MSASDSRQADLDEAVGELLAPLLAMLRAFEKVQERWHPPRVPQLVRTLDPFGARLEAALDAFRDTSRHGGDEFVRAQLERAAEEALKACIRFGESPDDRRAMGVILSATRCYARACEALLPLAPRSPEIDSFLREVPATRTAIPESREAANDRGILVRGNERGRRGGYSLYVPERTRERFPLVVALHGGGGHGADFLWTWLRQARTRGFLLASLTSLDNTWSLRDPDVDRAPLFAMVEQIRQEYPVDASHMLVSGWSDGGTYAMMAGVERGSPFTHIASVSGSLHPRVVTGPNVERTHGKPFYLIHGTQDWMFPVANAHRARDYLRHVGARLEFHEVDHLSHNWAARESLAILPWFDPTLTLPDATQRGA